MKGYNHLNITEKEKMKTQMDYSGDIFLKK